MFNESYHVYIITNYNKTVFYTGITNNLQERLMEHYSNRGNPIFFAGKYHCCYLLHFESYKYVFDAIDREKEIKGWSRKKKEKLIKEENPDLDFKIRRSWNGLLSKQIHRCKHLWMTVALVEVRCLKHFSYF
jgi:putative endonuclease